MRPARRLFVLVAVATWLGCAGGPRPVKTPFGPYGDALDRSTRSGAIYDGWKSQLFVIATHDSEPLRAARKVELARMFNEPFELSAKRVAPLADDTDLLSFVIVAAAPDSLRVDFDAPESSWSVRLGEGPTSIGPSSIKRLDVPPAILEALYPWVKTPWIAFRVVFDVPQQASPLLVVSGAPGRARLDF